MNILKNLGTLLTQNQTQIEPQADTLEMELHCAEEGYQLQVVSMRYDAAHNKIIVNIKKEEELYG